MADMTDLSVSSASDFYDFYRSESASSATHIASLDAFRGSSASSTASVSKFFTDFAGNFIQYNENLGTNVTGSFWDTYNSIYQNFSDQSGENPFADAAAAVGAGIGGGLSAVSTAVSPVIGAVSNVSTGAETVINTVLNIADDTSDFIASGLTQSLNTVLQYGGGNSVFVSILSKGLSIFSQAFASYKDGVTETSFGNLMEASWNKSSTSFVSTFLDRTDKKYKVNFLTNTPLNSGSQQENIYGSMILGVPPLFNHIVDPKSRAITKTFLRDARYLALTPGLPKYNGSLYVAKANDDALHQTPDGLSMMEYLNKNGYDSNSLQKDRRYYTFATDYDDYYSYLESMLNPLWIKLGLATDASDRNTFNLLSFFGQDGSGGMRSTVLSQYQSAIGFYINNGTSFSESINSSQTGYGSNLASQVNEQSSTYQQLNYLTGMGTGGAVRNTSRQAGIGVGLYTNVKDMISKTFTNTSAFLGEHHNIISAVAGTAANVALDLGQVITQTDPGASIQTFATTNGMQVLYPELWSSASFTKATNVSFEFVSPYGDPLSIFQYVYVPFCSLLTFALPRQADDNGFVSPFFVRADVPGYFTVDFGMISDFSWIRGGSNNLWTKDGLPRAISGTFTIVDLYPFLAMTKRYSFLSANPNYTSFLDSLAGLHAVYDTDSTTSMNDFWKAMLNRVNGKEGTAGAAASSGLWNRYSISERTDHASYASTPRQSRLQTNGDRIPWMRKASDS